MRRFVFCSSISVYGDVGPATITEGTPLRPTSVYGATEGRLRAAHPGICGRIRAGGRQPAHRPRLRPLPPGELPPQSDDRGRGGRPATSRSPAIPAFLYHYVYVDDVAEAIAAALEAPRLPERVYNVGSGEALTMPDTRAAGRSRDSRSSRSARVRRGRCAGPADPFDVTAIGRDLGWTPRYPMAGGALRPIAPPSWPGRPHDDLARPVASL